MRSTSVLAMFMGGDIRMQLPIMPPLPINTRRCFISAINALVAWVAGFLVRRTRNRRQTVGATKGANTKLGVPRRMAAADSETAETTLRSVGRDSPRHGNHGLPKRFQPPTWLLFRPGAYFSATLLESAEL